MSWREKAAAQCDPPAVAEWIAEVPFCGEEKCPQYDGKRCRVLGSRPSALCEPIVTEMARMLDGRLLRSEL